MPQIFDSATISRFEANGEQNFAAERPCIVDRTSIEIFPGQANYTLPNYVVSIRRITYRGWKLYPMPHRTLRQSFLSGTQQSRPFWYIFNNQAQATIQLFPVPVEHLTPVATAAGLWGSDLINKFVVEFYRLPDSSQGITIPIFMRRRLLKCYINKNCFRMEGKAQNLKASEYWSGKYESLKEIFVNLLDELNSKPRNIVASSMNQRPYGYTPPPPILPIDRFGISVDEPY